MQNTVNSHEKRYAEYHPKSFIDVRLYTCVDCGELVADRYRHDKEHTRRDRACDPVIVFAKMSEIVTILWGPNGC